MRSNTQSKSARASIEWIFTILFVLILWIPSAYFLTGKIIQSPGEATTAAPSIANNIDLRSYFDHLNRFADQQFPFRAQAIARYNWLKHYLLRAPSKQVIVGKEHWLFYRGDQVFEDLAGEIAMSEQELDNWFHYFEERQRALAEQGTKYLLVLVPGKATIHPEKIPTRLATNPAQTRLDQVAERHAQGSPLNLYNMKNDLLGLKSEIDEVYWKFDTHWNGETRLRATRWLADRAKELYPSLDTELITQPLETFEAANRACDLIDMLGMRQNWPSYTMDMLRWETPATLRFSQSPLSDMPLWKDLHAVMHPLVTENSEGSGRLLLIYDSFLRVGGMPLIPSEIPMCFGFERFIGIWTWVKPADLQWMVEQEKPDLVIEQRVERYLHILP